MRKFFLYCVVFFCFCLSGWQVYRFITKYQSFQFFIKQNDLIDTNEQIFIDENVGDLYSWSKKSYKVNLKNNKIYQAIESFIGDSEEKDIEVRNMSNENLFFKNEVCGEYIPNYNFALYRPKKIGDFTKNGYSIIVPMIFDKQIFLVNYFWAESIDEIEDEMDKLNHFQENQKNLLPEKLLIKKNVGLCFEGVLMSTKQYYSHWALSFFSMNDLKKNIWSNLNEKDLKKHFQDLKNDDTNLDLVISDYILDTNLQDFSNSLRNYQHHFFYAIMWALSGIYLIYIIKKCNKVNC